MSPGGLWEAALVAILEGLLVKVDQQHRLVKEALAGVVHEGGDIGEVHGIAIFDEEFVGETWRDDDYESVIEGNIEG